ncbi:hypothetical protein CRT08_08400 [Campylobacter coli]|nr:hypothetical protein [Campylobacter coli]
MEYVKSYDFAYYTTRINHFLQRKDRQNIKVLQDFFCSLLPLPKPNQYLLNLSYEKPQLPVLVFQ